MTSNSRKADLSQQPSEDWNRHVLPGSRIEQTQSAWLFGNEPTPSGTYTNAQIDDYQKLHRKDFLWTAPLSLTVQARFSHPAGQLQGTAGFGFWNDPFMMTDKRPPMLPRATWFFYASPQSNMDLAMGVPGQGWKAATIDMLRLPFFLLAPTAPLAVPLMNIPPIYQTLWPIGQRAIGVGEAVVDASMTDWHRYRIDWGRELIRFFVDDKLILDCDTPPRGRLGFVMWIDNQAMVVSPKGRFGWRTVDVPEEQWMEISELEIAAG